VAPVVAPTPAPPVEPVPEPAVVDPGTATEAPPPVVAPTPAPRANARPARVSSPAAPAAGVEAPVQVVEAPPTLVVAPVAVVPTPPQAVAPVVPAAPIITVELQDVSVDVQGDAVVVRGTLSNGDVKPFHYPVEGADPRYPTQYVVALKGGVSTFGVSKLPVASPLVASVTIAQEDGKLLLRVNSPSQVAPRWAFASAGRSFTVTVHAP